MQQNMYINDDNRMNQSTLQMNQDMYLSSCAHTTFPFHVWWPMQIKWLFVSLGALFICPKEYQISAVISDNALSCCVFTGLELMHKWWYISPAAWSWTLYNMYFPSFKTQYLCVQIKQIMQCFFGHIPRGVMATFAAAKNQTDDPLLQFNSKRNIKIS